MFEVSPDAQGVVECRRILACQLVCQPSGGLLPDLEARKPGLDSEWGCLQPFKSTLRPRATWVAASMRSAGRV